MKLWLLDGSYDMAVIRAETEQDARMIKKQTYMDQGMSGDEYLDPSQYPCTEITVDGEAGIVTQYSG